MTQGITFTALLTRHGAGGQQSPEDMAESYSRCLTDPDCTDKMRQTLTVWVKNHLAIEASPKHSGTKPFTDKFPSLA